MDDTDYCANQIRKFDSDRYLTALFAPQPARDSLMALYAFNLELARCREAARDPMLGRIRLQWWWEVIDECYSGQPRHHQVVVPLAAAIHRHDLSRSLFERMIDGRERDLDPDPPASLADLEAYATATSGALTQLALEALDTNDAEALQQGEAAGTAWALVGILRATPHLLRAGRVMLPRDMLAAHGLAPGNLATVEARGAVAQVTNDICANALILLSQAGKSPAKLPKRGRPALLPASLARLYLARLARSRYDLFDPRVSAPLPFRSWRLMLPALTGRF